MIAQNPRKVVANLVALFPDATPSDPQGVAKTVCRTVGRFQCFYRATAHIFLVGFFVAERWSQAVWTILTTLYDGTPLEPGSMWTWVTGDQHLINFGACFQHGELVFSVNDFDEAAIYDFPLI
jgi:uncharacterized protein (DUF2252 family)